MCNARLTGAPFIELSLYFLAVNISYFVMPPPAFQNLTLSSS